ncbi:putative ABC transporter, AAA+ ATPase domain, P-loop containing nucleoside triphosphate hydrolase [Helianthus annuus]|uniref:ABC transporter, AAA+ ATPase domain, P-loop containing nucleoside triphosphate hydrolase n=1 Tax=Helianthus annuus TaxID=4232 RepID=A0A9K3MZ75_HELAN|nr:putative ABC transporter, AAA+ ATPase domain, P-loop containing nucleoside triphosphate hydrolase [Helianthus annuus]KAJ0500778.1 putative ABC transporter, AAA+ ATPase domain, P-loop containing nucleoside triphosphate hydrolase [Helianthus annuus]KAJ0516647.1 putative ABC transporter, AAA+ ATPase domain, P-loop containing nucleoside triphosphate hydrolase [Helianthus annuus]KAJ0684652.1 putative ABC transporter, AAA+ ATPase domain, P-loop containing nucleoside triphosphate hydrolase [Helianth
MEPSHDIKVQNPQEVEITSQRNHSGNGKVEADINNGVCLTWKDLCVMVPDGQTGGTRSILQGVTGYARPGELLAIMGPSGSGKSTLLDALAGRLDRKTRNTGDILVNGIKKTLAYGTSAYVTQDDTLITTLTVRESVYYSAQLQLPDSMSKTEKKERAEMTIKEMGLQDSIDTRIGGWGAKGLSGGQKRRVSICIEILTRPKLLFLDEPTSGLDSAASYYVMSRIARLDQHEGRTIIASIHQPSSEVFGLFHNLCLLSSGRTVYFGKTSYANEFFTLNGFPCPNFQNPSDHFLRTINKDFDEDIELGLGGRKPTEEVIKTLVDSYKSSTTYQEVNNTVAEICEKNGQRWLTRHRTKLGDSINHRSHRSLCHCWCHPTKYQAISFFLRSAFPTNTRRNHQSNPCQKRHRTSYCPPNDSNPSISLSSTNSSFITRWSRPGSRSWQGTWKATCYKSILATLPGWHKQAHNLAKPLRLLLGRTSLPFSHKPTTKLKACDTFSTTGNPRTKTTPSLHHLRAYSHANRT